MARPTKLNCFGAIGGGPGNTEIWLRPEQLGEPLSHDLVIVSYDDLDRPACASVRLLRS
jgi:hypothetical protein